MTKLEKIIAEEGLGEICYNYSGRNMFGQTCVGIVTTTPMDCIAKSGIPGARIDSMGLSYIVYWPKIKGVGHEET